MVLYEVDIVLTLLSRVFDVVLYELDIVLTLLSRVFDGILV